MTLGIDISHWQGTPDIAALKAQGVAFVGIKAWQGNSPDPAYKTNVAACIAAGMPFWAYAWVLATDNTVNVGNALDFIGPSVVLALDWEEAGVPASAVELWMDVYEKRAGRQGLVYYGLFPPAPASARIGQWPRWFPRYNTKPGLAAWDGVTFGIDWRKYYMLWQYSSKGTFTGIEGTFDLNQLAPSAAQQGFLDWLAGSHPAVPAATATQEQQAGAGETAHPTLIQGDSGADVHVLQALLGVPWLAQNSSFDAATDYLVRGFQASAGLPVDGVVGPATWAALTRKA